MENQQSNVVVYSSHVSVHNNVVTIPNYISVPNNVVTSTPNHVSVPNNVVTTPDHVPVPVVNDVYVPWNINVNLSLLSDEEYFRSVPPGYRFNPHDWELIVHYLMKKINNEMLPRNKIYVVDLYKCNPERLANNHRTGSHENEWFFFTPRNRKYKNGMRPNRAAEGGYWKATGADKTIKHNGEEIGLRKALVFYTGKPPHGKKTSWIMHEFRLKNAPIRSRTSDNDMKLDDWILCKIYKKVHKPNNNRNQQRDGNNPEEAGDNKNKDTLSGDSTIEVENSFGSNKMENTLNSSEGNNEGNGNNYTRQFNNVANHGFPSQNLGAAAQMRLQNLPSMRSGLAINENASTSKHIASGTTMIPPVSSWHPNLPFFENYGANEVTRTNMMVQIPYRTQDLPLMGNYVTTSDNYAAPDPVESPNNSFTTNSVTIPDHLDIMPTGLDGLELPEVPPIEGDDAWEYWLAEEKKFSGNHNNSSPRLSN